MNEQIVNWAAERGIFRHSDPSKQFLKLTEELGELAQAMQRHDKDAIQDAIGDMTVVLTLMAHMYGWTLEDCRQAAWEQIQHRKGEMRNGVFVKRTGDQTA